MRFRFAKAAVIYLAAAMFILLGEGIFTIMARHFNSDYSTTENNNFFKSITSLIARPLYAQSLKKRLDMPLLNGYRVQIAASGYEEEAKSIIEKAAADLDVDAHVFYEKGIWKIRLGDFVDKNSAGDFCVSIREDGYPDAFVVESQIKVQAVCFRVQVSAHESRKAAEEYAAAMRRKLGEKVIVVKEDRNWKVRIGEFSDKSQTDRLMKRLKSLGIKDAFIIKEN